MHLELVSLLRCPVPHADGWLVASVSRAHDRYIYEGELGCPICGAEYAIRGGVTYMSGVETDNATTGAQLSDGPSVAPPRSAAHDATEILRLAAFLGVSDAMQAFALVGHDVGDAEQLQELIPVRCFVVNPPLPRAVASERGPSGVLVCSNTVPLAAEQLSGVAFFASGSGDDALFLAASVRALKPGGRMCAAAGLPVPQPLAVLARDDSHWVAQRSPMATAPITLTRR